MPWPGAPKSASSPPINLPSVRYPHTLNENSSMADVADAMRTAFNGLAVHEQAFANLPDTIATSSSAASAAVLEQIQSETVTPAPYIPLGGPTANRPPSPVNYGVYFDTDLGFPVWWTGTGWVAASGMPA
jgi:hypothetical protein